MTNCSRLHRPNSLALWFFVVALSGVSIFGIDRSANAQSEIQTAKLSKGDGFVDAGSGLRILGPFLADSCNNIAVVFPLANVDLLQIAESAPFVIIVNHAGSGEVKSTLGVSTFPTTLLVAGLISVDDDTEFNVTYELEISSLERGQEEFKETIHFYTAELAANESHDFNLESGRLFIVDCKAGELPQIKQFKKEIKSDCLVELIENDLPDEEKAEQILNLFAKPLQHEEEARSLNKSSILFRLGSSPDSMGNWDVGIRRPELSGDMVDMRELDGLDGTAGWTLWNFGSDVGVSLLDLSNGYSSDVLMNAINNLARFSQDTSVLVLGGDAVNSEHLTAANDVPGINWLVLDSVQLSRKQIDEIVDTRKGIRVLLSQRQWIHHLLGLATRSFPTVFSFSRQFIWSKSDLVVLSAPNFDAYCRRKEPNCHTKRPIRAKRPSYK